ncbi:MAG: type II toxin-antitoxin system YafQ family toxin [Patescibacteria group bacterium]
MYKIRKTSKFRKSLKKYARSGKFDAEAVKNIIDTLARGEKLEERHKDHQLSGKMKNSRECHIKPNLLLIYKIEKDYLILILVNIGSHSDLFG